MNKTTKKITQTSSKLEIESQRGSTWTTTLSSNQQNLWLHQCTRRLMNIQPSTNFSKPWRNLISVVNWHFAFSNCVFTLTNLNFNFLCFISVSILPIVIIMFPYPFQTPFLLTFKNFRFLSFKKNIKKNKIQFRHRSIATWKQHGGI